MNRTERLMALMLILTPMLLGSDIDSLRDRHEAFVRAWNERDAKALSNIYHEDVVLFRRDHPFAVVGGGQAAEQQVIRYLEQTELIQFEFVQVEYRVHGDTGIVWGHARYTDRRKGEHRAVTSYRRTMMTFAKIDGEWYLVAQHNSAIPD